MTTFIYDSFLDADNKWEVDFVWIFVDRKLIKYKPVTGFHLQWVGQEV